MANPDDDREHNLSRKELAQDYSGPKHDGRPGALAELQAKNKAKGHKANDGRLKANRGGAAAAAAMADREAKKHARLLALLSPEARAELEALPNA